MIRLSASSFSLLFWCVEMFFFEINYYKVEYVRKKEKEREREGENENKKFSK